MCNQDFIAIKTDEDWASVKTKAAQDQKKLLLAKLSPACPVSHMAERELRDWHTNKKAEGVIFVEVDVIRARNLARSIATEVGVQHESPQLICFDSEIKPLWSESHQNITSTFLDSKLA